MSGSFQKRTSWGEPKRKEAGLPEGRLPGRVDGGGFVLADQNDFRQDSRGRILRRPNGSANMKCLRCQTQMNKVARDSLLIDMCPDCGGIWLDAGEFERMESGSGHEVAHLLQQARKELLQDAGRLVSFAGMCPKCEGARLHPMKKRGVELDICPNCKGLFFDEKELELVLGDKSANWFASILDLIRR
jgi:hypothetical protein